MVRARFTGRNHYHDGEPLDQGDVVELTEAQFEQWSYQFVRLDDGGDASGEDAADASDAAADGEADEAASAAADEEAPGEEDGAGDDDAAAADDAGGDADGDGGVPDEADAAPEPPAAEDLDPNPSDLTVDELRDRVRDVDEPALVRAIFNAEAAGKERKSALDAINARLNALEA